MGKSDDKGEPVKTVTIGGKKVEVPIIFVLPEEVGEKEIERYERPKVHIDSKKVAPLLAAGAVLGAAEGITDKVDDLDLPKPEAETVGSNSNVAQAESKEEPLDELTDGKLEEVEKLPFPVPREEKKGEADEATDKLIQAVKDPKKREELIDLDTKQQTAVQDMEMTRSDRADRFIRRAEDDEEETPYLDMLSDKPRRKKKPVKVSYRSLFDKGYGKAQALSRSVEEQKKRGAKTDDELAVEAEKKIPKGQQGMLNYNYLFGEPEIEEKKDYLTDEEGDEIEKSWRGWLNKKGALGEGQGDWRISGEPKNTPKDPKDYSQWEKHLYGDSNRARDALGVSDMQSHGGQSTSERRGFMDEDLLESTTQEQTNPKTRFPWDEGKDAYSKRVPVSSSPVSSAGNKPRSTSKEPAPQDEGKPDQRADPRTLKSWEKWLQNKGLGALGEGKLDRKTGKKMKLRRRQPTLDDYPEDDNGDKKDET